MTNDEFMQLEAAITEEAKHLTASVRYRIYRVLADRDFSTLTRDEYNAFIWMRRHGCMKLILHENRPKMVLDKDTTGGMRLGAEILAYSKK